MCSNHQMPLDQAIQLVDSALSKGTARLELIKAVRQSYRDGFAAAGGKVDGLIVVDLSKHATAGDCPTCGGTGADPADPDADCPTCKGTGRE